MRGLSDISERGQALALWREAFGDSEEYINFFFDNHHSCRAITEKRGGEVASALFLIDGEMNICGEKFPAYYLFAACTLKKYRGMGLMSALLSKAEEFAREQGREYIALVPAEESLFDYYEKYGYKTAFYIKRQPVGEALQVPPAKFCWCEEHIAYILAESERFGSEIADVGTELFTVYDSEYIKAPAESEADSEKYGMLLALNGRAAAIFPKNAYIGLTLE